MIGTFGFCGHTVPPQTLLKTAVAVRVAGAFRGPNDGRLTLTARGTDGALRAVKVIGALDFYRALAKSIDARHTLTTI